jgi:hypothetical protein
MATIIMGSYMVRYPLGGNISWALQYLLGFRELGHEVYFVEKYVHEDSCYDPVAQHMSDDCSYGVKVVSELLASYGLEDHWCFVESGDQYHGLSRKRIEEIFSRADLYIENGAHGAWNEEAFTSRALKVYIDVDPAFTQVNFYRKLKSGIDIPAFDRYYTNGMNIGKDGNIIPDCGIQWHYIFNPVNTSLFNQVAPPDDGPYSTIMNWISYRETVQYKGVSYGHKSIEFDKFATLPTLVDVNMEMAVSGLDGPDRKRVKQSGWHLVDAQKVTFTIDDFKEYLRNCRGEFSVVKNMYQATSSAWFSDKSAAFMASGRPVILQETGFSEYLPTGEGLFAVKNVEEAKDAIEMIEARYQFHSDRALEIAREYLEATKVLGKFINELGL